MTGAMRQHVRDDAIWCVHTRIMQQRERSLKVAFRDVRRLQRMGEPAALRCRGEALRRRLSRRTAAPSSAPSIGTLNHLLVGDRIWMRRFTGEGPTYTRLDEIPCDDLATLRGEREAEDKRIIDYVDGLDDEKLAATFSYRTIASPMDITQPLAPALSHFFNHQTHHRGQVHGADDGARRPRRRPLARHDSVSAGNRNRPELTGNGDGQAHFRQRSCFSSMMRLVIRPKPRSRARRSCRLCELRASSRGEFSVAAQASASMRPSSSAARMAQPGSDSCRQSEKRQSRGERHDVGEDIVDASVGIGELQLAHARRVEQPSAGLQPMQRAAGGRMAAMRVVLANAARRLRGVSAAACSPASTCRRPTSRRARPSGPRRTRDAAPRTTAASRASRCSTTSPGISRAAFDE